MERSPEPREQQEDREQPTGFGQMKITWVSLTDTHHFCEGAGKAETENKFNTCKVFLKFLP